jgi:hypothetical protein
MLLMLIPPPLPVVLMMLDLLSFDTLLLMNNGDNVTDSNSGLNYYGEI